MPAFPLHKCKEGSTHWIYHYTLHKWRREMGLGALRNVSLKQVHVSMQLNGVLHALYNHT